MSRYKLLFTVTGAGRFRLTRIALRLRLSSRKVLER